MDGSFYNEFVDRMCYRARTDLLSLSTSMIEVGEELKVVFKMWTEDRRSWVSDEVYSSAKRKRHANKEYRKMRRVYGVNDERTENDKEYDFKRKKRPRR